MKDYCNFILLAWSSQHIAFILSSEVQTVLVSVSLFRHSPNKFLLLGQLLQVIMPL